MKTGN